MHTQILDAPGALDGLRVADDFGAIVPSHRLPGIMGQNLADGGTIAAAIEDGTIVGYATVVDFAPDWRRFAGLHLVVELGAIEVARSARRRGVATAVLDRLVAHAPMDGLVVVAHGAESHWEPEEGSLAPGAYRRMLLRLLGHAGFVRHDSDDPEVLEHPLNFVAARVGARVPPLETLGFLERLYEPARAVI